MIEQAGALKPIADKADELLQTDARSSIPLDMQSPRR